MLLLASETNGHPRELRVLVVDDEAPIRRLLVSLLLRSLRGYRVDAREVANGEDAIRQLQSENFDLVITDYRMGAKNGVDVLEAACRVNERAGRILVTGYADVPVAVEGVNRGRMEGFVPKPWDNNKLVQLIQGVLDHRSRVDDARGAPK